VRAYDAPQHATPPAAYPTPPPPRVGVPVAPVPVSGDLTLRSLTAADFAEARAVADAWFGRPVGLTMHRLFFDQLGPAGLRAAAAAEPGRMLGVLLGFASLSEPELAYIHFVMVDPAARGRGIAGALYREFGRRMAAQGCRRVRTLAAPTNGRSLRFHESLGFVGTFASAFVGPGQDRVVFERTLPFDPAP
jgi:ribosomal protein S18 acetylase RimI-like enzyme